MVERNTSIDRRLTAEYWNNHHAGDGCDSATLTAAESMEVRPQLDRELLKMRASLTAELERYALLQGGNRIPLARFEKGNDFIPDNYPHGTLIRVIDEGLNLRHLAQGYDGYSVCEQFGFVVDASGITTDGRNAVMYVARRLIYGASPEVIKVGIVEHTRLNLPFNLDMLSRVTGVEIISMGAGFRKTVEEPVKPQRRIFGIPLPQPIS